MKKETIRFYDSHDYGNSKMKFLSPYVHQITRLGQWFSHEKKNKIKFSLLFPIDFGLFLKVRIQKAHGQKRP